MQDTFGDRQAPAPSHLDLDAARRRQARGAPASHHLVAHLSGGLRIAYAAQPETEVVDAFAAIIARMTDSDTTAA